MTLEVHEQTNCLLCDAPSKVVMCRKCMAASKRQQKERINKHHDLLVADIDTWANGPGRISLDAYLIAHGWRKE